MRLLFMVAVLLLVSGCEKLGYRCKDYIILSVGGCDAQGKCGVMTTGGWASISYPAVLDTAWLCKWGKDDSE